MNLYTVHDKAIDSYQGVICLPSERDAVEQFRVVCNQPDTQFNKHPGDFTLLQIGTYDSDLGLITPITPKIITNAVSLIEKPYQLQDFKEVAKTKLKPSKSTKKTKGKK